MASTEHQGHPYMMSSPPKDTLNVRNGIFTLASLGVICTVSGSLWPTLAFVFMRLDKQCKLLCVGGGLGLHSNQPMIHGRLGYIVGQLGFIPDSTSINLFTLALSKMKYVQSKSRYKSSIFPHKSLATQAPPSTIVGFLPPRICLRCCN